MTTNPETYPAIAGDADVMLTAELLQTCGMSPLDRELWAQEHGRHYAGGSKRRLLAEAVEASRAS